jgi:hypothetical protein
MYSINGATKNNRKKQDSKHLGENQHSKAACIGKDTTNKMKIKVPKAIKEDKLMGTNVEDNKA